MISKGELEPGNRERPEDFYLFNPPHQPKREIADYVERNGILVPHRFVNLNDALSSGKPFIVRSEHKQDYNGVSGLIESFKVTQESFAAAQGKFGVQLEAIDWEHVFADPIGRLERKWVAADKMMAQIRSISQEELENNLKHLSRNDVTLYCRMTGINPEQFYSGISYSYWELLGGVNRTVVADSAIPNRYHIFTTTPLDEAKAGYSIVENGEVITSISSLSPEMDSTIPSAISFYDSVKKLNYFDQNQCPLIEIQTVGNDNYFLQYHRGTSFNPSQFMLDREQEEEEVKATFVRGATPEQGMNAKIRLHFREEIPLPQEDGGIDNPVIKIFSELMVRRRMVQISRAEDMRDLASLTMGFHLSKSQLFKPLVSVVLKSKDVRTLFDFEKMFRSDPESALQSHVSVVCDGRNAYVKKIE